MEWRGRGVLSPIDRMFLLHLSHDVFSETEYFILTLLSKFHSDFDMKRVRTHVWYSFRKREFTHLPPKSNISLPYQNNNISIRDCNRSDSQTLQVRRAPVWSSGSVLRLPAERPEFESPWLLLYKGATAQVYNYI